MNYTFLKGFTENKEYYVKLLLNSIGAKNFNMITALATPTSSGELEYGILMKFLEDHLAPKKNILVAQQKFLLKYQTGQQSMLNLTDNIGDCEFK